LYNRVQIDIGRTMVDLKGQKDILVHRLADLMMPTLLVWGARDPVVPAWHSQNAAALISDCRVHVFPSAGHSVYRQKVEEFSQVLLSFLKGNREP
jgi:pimeloyl-ACP methyl ester carboxylesterase